MTESQVDDLARKKEPLPDEAGLCDMMLYHILISLYSEYKAGVISKERAKVEKNKAFEKHKELELGERIYSQHTKRITELSTMASEAFKEHSCPLCVRMYDIFTGYHGREQQSK